jgi:hypothetical protein
MTSFKHKKSQKDIALITMQNHALGNKGGVCLLKEEHQPAIISG